LLPRSLEGRSLRARTTAEALMATPSSCDEPRKPDKEQRFPPARCMPSSLVGAPVPATSCRIGPRQRYELGSDLDARLINEDQRAGRSCDLADIGVDGQMIGGIGVRFGTQCRDCSSGIFGAALGGNDEPRRDAPRADVP